MPPVHLVPIGAADLDDVLDFEFANRAYFESHVNARPTSYYSREGVQAAIAQAVRDSELDQGYQYLVRDDHGRLVARVNLARVRRAHFHCAELGYRVAESAGGRGIATEAVRQVVDLAFGPLKLLRVEANARPENAGSTRVLQRNGFTSYGRSTRSFELGGVWYDRLHFERRAGD